MVTIAARPALGLLFCLPLCGLSGHAAKAAPVWQPNLCQQMVDRWDGKWPGEEVTRCKPWRKQRAAALSTALERCTAKHQHDSDDEACEKEQDAFFNFSTASWTLESITFGPRAKGVVNSPYGTEAMAMQRARAEAAEKAEADRRAKRKQEIIDSFGSGTTVPVSNDR